MIYRKSDSDSVEKCSEILKNGGVVIIPTDTVYGFSGLVSEDFKTDEKIRMIKGRSENKPFIQLIAFPEDVYKYSDDLIPEDLLSYWPGPLTIIVKEKKSEKTTAFRCPGDSWLRKVISLCGSPIYSTSVNRSGCPVLAEESKIVDEFESETDLIVLDGDTQNPVPSTIVKITETGYEIIRKGAVDL